MYFVYSIEPAKILTHLFGDAGLADPRHHAVFSRTGDLVDEEIGEHFHMAKVLVLRDKFRDPTMLLGIPGDESAQIAVLDESGKTHKSKR